MFFSKNTQNGEKRTSAHGLFFSKENHSIKRKEKFGHDIKQSLVELKCSVPALINILDLIMDLDHLLDQGVHPFHQMGHR